MHPEPANQAPNAIKRWLDLASAGTAVERQQAIDHLREAVRSRPDDDTAFNYYGLALHENGRSAEAIPVFQYLVENWPEHDIYRLSLATMYSQTQEFALAETELEWLQEHGTSEEGRKIAGEQLAGMREFLGRSPEDFKLLQLQIAALRERVARDGEAADFLNLGRLYRQQQHRDPRGETDWLDQARRVLETGADKFPNDVALLEHLIGCYMSADPNGRLNESVRRLRDLDPTSKVHDVLDDLNESKTQQFQSAIDDKLSRATKMAFSGEEKVRRAAIENLGLLVQQYPANPEYRMSWAWAMLADGRYDDVGREAKRLEPDAPRSHEFHFNLGQLFWFSGDKEKGRKHLLIAADLARDDQQREDVRQRLSYLESLP